MRIFGSFDARARMRFQAGVRTAEDPLTRYDGMGQEIAALEEFYRRAHAHGMILEPRPLEFWE